MSAKKKNIRIVRLPRYGAWKFEHPDGVVTVYSERGKSLTNERINWLLDIAKNKKLHG